MSVPDVLGEKVSLRPVREVGVDWITVTCSDKRKVALLLDAAFVWLEIEEKKGNKIRPWSMSGYHGFHCGEVSFGEFNGSLLLRMSGNTARETWRRAYAHSTNCSRIDLQVTVSNVISPSDVIAHHYNEAREHFSTWKKPPSVHLWHCNTTSDTLYLNRRVSESFGRIYDKAVESKRECYAGCLRYEVEFKKDMAVLVSEWLAKQSDERIAILSRVHRFFSERGCAPAFSSEDVTPIVVTASPSDTERQLEWLRKSVRCSVKELLACGRRADVLTALGL